MEKAVRIYFLIFFLLVVFGMVMVFNIRMFNVSSAEASVTKQIVHLVMNFGIAGAGFILAYLLNIAKLKNSSMFLLPLMISVLLATFAIGIEINGAKRWINLGFMMLQPAELAKIVVVIYLSEVLYNKKEKISLWRELFFPLSVVFVISALIALEDLGTACIIFIVSVALLLLGGMRWKCFFCLLALAPICFIILVAMPGKEYRVRRLYSFMDPWEVASGDGYQQVQSEIALGVGGTTGVGFGNSTRKIPGGLPEPHTDFIFSIIGEEFGFVGSLVLILLITAFFVIGSYFALSARDQFNFYMISGFVLMLAGQSVFNLGVVTTLLPNKGVPLPFISYGGSALLTYSIMVGFILNAVTSESRR